MIWFGLGLWHINPCRLFNTKSSLYMYIKYIWFGLVWFYDISTTVGYLMSNSLYILYFVNPSAMDRRWQSGVQLVWIWSFPAPLQVAFTKTTEPNLPNHLPIAWGRTDLKNLALSFCHSSKLSCHFVWKSEFRVCDVTPSAPMNTSTSSNHFSLRPVIN